MIEGIDYYVHRVRFPNKANPAMSFPNDDGTFDIYLNTLYDDERLKKELEHELRHIQGEHFYVDIPIERAEAQAEGAHVNTAFHHPDGVIPHFFSEESFANYIKQVATQQHVDLSQFKWDGK